MNTVVCKTRFCPGCGLEIVCEKVEGNVFQYLVNKEPVRLCPACDVNLSYDTLRSAPSERKKGKEKNVVPRESINKAGLIEQIQEDRKLFPTKADAERALNSVGEILFINLAQGKEVIWSDLGRFKISMHKERAGRNPQTGEPITIPARMGIRFQPSKSLKDALDDQSNIFMDT